MISELLATGKENARTGRQLAVILQCDIREITQQIEKERRQGQPICAGSGETPGYYLAADADELQHYCERLNRRAGEMQKTRRALVKVLEQIRQQQAAQI